MSNILIIAFLDPIETRKKPRLALFQIELNCRILYKSLEIS